MNRGTRKLKKAMAKRKLMKFLQTRGQRGKGQPWGQSAAFTGPPASVLDNQKQGVVSIRQAHRVWWLLVPVDLSSSVRNYAILPELAFRSLVEEASSSSSAQPCWDILVWEMCSPIGGDVSAPRERNIQRVFQAQGLEKHLWTTKRLDTVSLKKSLKGSPKSLGSQVNVMGSWYG